jgi:DNA polymerase delta subunit 1
MPLAFALYAAIFEQGITLKWLNSLSYRSTTYESNVIYALRFMIDCSVVGGNWVELPAGSYSLVQAQVRLVCRVGGEGAQGGGVSHACVQQDALFRAGHTCRCIRHAAVSRPAPGIYHGAPRR